MIEPMPERVWLVEWSRNIEGHRTFGGYDSKRLTRCRTDSSNPPTEMMRETEYVRADIVEGLVKNMSGIMDAYEYDLRTIMGNTNFNVLVRWIKTVRGEES